ncbi:hypothetical protein PISMIDRAFT_684609, partial [Pisolithus microcarpus 441]
RHTLKPMMVEYPVLKMTIDQGPRGSRISDHLLTSFSKSATARQFPRGATSLYEMQSAPQTTSLHAECPHGALIWLTHSTVNEVCTLLRHDEQRYPSNNDYHVQKTPELIVHTPCLRTLRHLECTSTGFVVAITNGWDVNSGPTHIHSE